MDIFEESGIENNTIEDFLIHLGKFLKSIYKIIDIEEEAENNRHVVKFSTIKQGFFDEKNAKLINAILSYDHENKLPYVELFLSRHFKAHHDNLLREFCADFVEKNPQIKIDVEWTRQKF